MNFDSYAITTWPGYFFQTALCIRSIIKHFPSRPIHIIVDTNHSNGHPIASPWPNFESDLKQYIQQQNLQLPEIVWHTVNEVPSIDQSNVGWWRQQLVKMCLDQYLPGDSWLVVDADIIFNGYPDFDKVPVIVDHLYARENDPITVGNRMYVKHMLGSDHRITYNGYPACCSGVPFRQLNRLLLTQMRAHVENLHQIDFVKLHVDLCSRGKIVGYDPECKSMVMSEFELIEIYRKYFTDHPLPIHLVPGTHTYTLEIRNAGVYRHSSLKDWTLGKDWLQEQGLQISDDHWQMSKLFIENMPQIQQTT
jgi:hypothetical protein